MLDCALYNGIVFKKKGSGQRIMDIIKHLAAIRKTGNWINILEHTFTTDGVLFALQAAKEHLGTFEMQREEIDDAISLAFWIKRENEKEDKSRSN